MSVVEVRQVKKNIKKHKNIIDNHNYTSNDNMQWGLAKEPIPKAFQVGSDSVLSEYKRVRRDIAKRQAYASQEKQMFDIHEAAKKAISKVAE